MGGLTLSSLLSCPVLSLASEAWRAKAAPGSGGDSLQTTALAQAAQWWESYCQGLRAHFPGQHDQVLPGH